MKKFVNNIDDILTESLAGFGDAHSDIVNVNLKPDFITRKSKPSKPKVSLISGGGSGHEPLHGGFVGYGMLDAACPGQVFSAPTPDQMEAAANHVNNGKLSLQKLVDLWSHGPERIHKIYNKGRIAKGYDADFTIVDLKKSVTISNSQQKSKTGWTPFDGMKVVGWPVATIIRGHQVMREDELISPIGQPVKFIETL